MFGYVIVNKEKLSKEEFDEYHSFYCGLCRELRERYGKTMSVLLNNDMTFLAVLLSGLEEPDTSLESKRCPVHPTRVEQIRRNIYTQYAAEMTVILSYYKCLDDVKDEGKHPRMLKKLQKLMDAVKEKYPSKVQTVEDVLNRISVLEEQNCSDLDLLCNTFGEALGALFAQEGSIWNASLYDIGYNMGRFIYLMDAYDDLEEDQKKKQFNPLIPIQNREDFDNYIESILELFMSQAADSFERLPVLTYSSILRNILYSGVWSRFEAVKQKRNKEKEQHESI